VSQLTFLRKPSRALRAATFLAGDILIWGVAFCAALLIRFEGTSRRASSTASR